MTDASATQPRSLRPFLTLWVGQVFSLLGSQLVQFSLIWWLTQQTGSATVLAVASIVGLVPQVVLGPFVGPLVDRWNRKRTMILADAAVALATLGLALLFLLGQAELWHVYAILFVRALCGTFHGPAITSSFSLMVPPEHLTRVHKDLEWLGPLLGKSASATSPGELERAATAFRASGALSAVQARLQALLADLPEAPGLAAHPGLLRLAQARLTRMVVNVADIS